MFIKTVRCVKSSSEYLGIISFSKKIFRNWKSDVSNACRSERTVKHHLNGKNNSLKKNEEKMARFYFQDKGHISKELNSYLGT